MLNRVKRVLSIEKLHNASITVSHSIIVFHFQTLQMLHKTPLQVTTSRCLHSSVDQPLPAGHAMEVEILQSEACQEPIGDIPRGSRVGVIGSKTGQSFAGDHDRHSPALEFLLAQHDTHLRVVDIGALGACDCHHAEVVGREHFHKACHAGGDNLGRLVIEMVLVLAV